jgi:hypothetical protein
MGKSSPSTPAEPDPNVVIQSQLLANIQQAVADANINRVNETSPWGSRTWNSTDGGTRWSVNDQVDPRIVNNMFQQIGQSSNLMGLIDGLMPGVRSTLGTPLDTSGAPARNPVDMTGAPELSGIDLSGMPARQTAIDGNLTEINGGAGARDQAFSLMMDRLRPEQAREREAMDARLAAQGLTQGTEAFQRDQRTLGEAQGNAQIDAWLKSGEEADRIFGQSLQTRQQQVNESLSNAGLIDRARTGALGEQTSIADNNRSNRGARLGEEIDLASDASSNRNAFLGEQEAARYRGLDEMGRLIGLLNNPSVPGGGATGGGAGGGIGGRSVDAASAFGLQQSARTSAAAARNAANAQEQQTMGQVVSSLLMLLLI